MNQTKTKESILGLKRILEDSVKGAAELLTETISYLEKHPELLSIEMGDETLRFLKQTRPIMAPFSELATRIELEWRRDPGQSADDIVSIMRSMIEEARVTIGKRTQAKLQERAPVRLITLSCSSTVVDAIKATAGSIAELRVLESLPGGEGARTVEALKGLIPKVMLMKDEDLDWAVKDSTVGIAGADTVFMDGVVVNKMQTLPLAQRLHEEKKPFFITASRWKFSSIRSSDMPEGDEGRFERIPSNLITDIISDEEL